MLSLVRSQACPSWSMPDAPPIMMCKPARSRPSSRSRAAASRCSAAAWAAAPSARSLSSQPAVTCRAHVADGVLKRQICCTRSSMSTGNSIRVHYCLVWLGHRACHELDRWETNLPAQSQCTAQPGDQVRGAKAAGAALPRQVRSPRHELPQPHALSAATYPCSTQQIPVHSGP